MGDIITDNLQGLRAAQDRIRSTNLNITKSNVVGAHRVDSITNYDGLTGGVNVTLSRATDRFLENAVNKTITALNQAKTIQDSLSSLQTTITDPVNNTKSILVGRVENFVNTAKQIITTPSTSLKQNFINKGVDLAKTISDTTEEILNLRLKADSDLSDSLLSVNGYISQLFHLNKAMSSSSSNELLDQRDNLVNRIAEFFEIKVSTGVNNNALISTANGSLNIVDSTTYAKFNYNSVPDRELFLQEEANIDSITMDLINSQGFPISNLKVVEGFDSSISRISGGRISGYLTLRDDILPKADEAVRSLSSQLMNTINAVHNKYSPFPPKTAHTSTKEFLYNDAVNWDGKLTIAPITRDGKSLEGNVNSGAVRPVTIDLTALSAGSINQSATVADLINEINAYLSSGPTDNRLALGMITEINPNPLFPLPPPTYLLNNFKIAGMSDVDVAGNFSFDLELDGSKYFGSKIEILSVTSPSGLAANLPQVFDLEKGQHTRTNQQISVGGILGGPQNIDIKIRVIGDNGIIEEGTARFNVNPTIPGGTQLRNQRIIGTVLGGAIVDTGSDTYAPITVARLVDENGIEIDPNSGTAGRLVIESRNSNNGLLISSDQDDTFNGFSHFFGMNDFFINGNIPGTFVVRDEITKNLLLLSAGTVHTGNSLQTVAQGSGVAASATMLFSNAPTNGDTITIGNITFTINNPLTGLVQNEVLGGITPLTRYTNLVNAINNHPELSSIIEATVNVATNTITINSKRLGISSNALVVGANLGSGRTVDITPTGGIATGPNAIINSTLGGGTDTNVQIAKFAQALGDNTVDFFKDIELLQSRLLDFEANSFVPADKNTIFGYAKFITELLSNQLNTAKSNFEITKTVKEDLSTKLKEIIGINKDEEIVKLGEYGQSLHALIAIAQLVASLHRSAIDLLKQ